jgi:FlaA1/EpsC-like NDP-sugar epimerase
LQYESSIYNKIVEPFLTRKNANKALVRQSGKLIIDFSIFTVSLTLAVFLSLGIKASISLIQSSIFALTLVVIYKTTIYLTLHLRNSIWRYSSITDLAKIIIANTLGTSAWYVTNLLTSPVEIAFRIYITEWLFSIFLSGGVRLVIRYLFESDFLRKNSGNGIDSSTKNILIYGAGRAGELLIRNIKGTKNSGVNLVGLLDDDPLKKGHSIHNISVLGDGSNINELVKKHKITDIYFAISSISGKETRHLLEIINENVQGEVAVKTIPGLKDLVNGKVSVNQLREIEIKDLLRRTPVELDESPVQSMIANKSVMVVGGGGSIGSELCNQIVAFGPKQLTIVDQSEFSLYTIEASLKEKYEGLPLECVVADAGNRDYMRNVFKKNRPDVIFHAAAYKHVPLMEVNPWSAIYNNLKSTLVLVELADEFLIDKFVLISTDKAVQPTNVMGATKRICEIITLLQSRKSRTNYMAVRFGNVLGSSGSVIPRFQRQIRNGGPVTVTDENMTRYFMLISEAVELVMQAGAIGKNGNIYVLDMGDPVRIDDLARMMIELSGLKVDEDIKIEYTGLRPGEKLYESLLLNGEECNTSIQGIMSLTPNLNVNGEYIGKVVELIGACYKYDEHTIRATLRQLVPEYYPQCGIPEGCEGIFNDDKKQESKAVVA